MAKKLKSEQVFCILKLDKARLWRAFQNERILWDSFAVALTRDGLPRSKIEGKNERILADSSEVAQSRDGLPRSKIEGKNERILADSSEVAGSRDGLPRSKIEGRKEGMWSYA